VLWSVVSRLPTVFSDVTAVTQHIEKLEEQIHGSAESPEDREASERRIASIRKQENKAEQEKKRLNDKVAELDAELEAARKREQEIHDQERDEQEKLNHQREQFKAVFGSDLQIHPGPPLHYDPGPKPKEPFYILWWPEEYRAKHTAWVAAKNVCDGFNAFQDNTGVSLVEVQHNIESIMAQIETFNGMLDDVGKRMSDLGRELKRYTDAPVTAWEDLNAQRKRLANTSFVRNVFWLLDIPTLLSCLATTAVAYSRMFLIYGCFGPRKLVRGQA
jgi:septal ring factor EnvC (AmiA/AmiB activator)